MIGGDKPFDWSSTVNTLLLSCVQVAPVFNTTPEVGTTGHYTVPIWVENLTAPFDVDKAVTLSVPSCLHAHAKVS
jgi:hypothetical protein